MQPTPYLPALILLYPSAWEKSQFFKALDVTYLNESVYFNNLMILFKKELINLIYSKQL